MNGVAGVSSNCMFNPDRPIPNGDNFYPLLNSFVSAARKGAGSGALHIFNLAVAAARAKPTIEKQSLALLDAAHQLVLYTGDLDRALDITDTIPLVNVKAHTLYEISTALFRRGRYADSEKVAKIALIAAESIPAEFTVAKDQIMSKISELFAKSSSIGMALEIAERMPNEELKPYTFLDICKRLYQDNHLDKARAVAQKAIDAALIIADPTKKSYALLEIAKYLVEMKEGDKAILVANKVKDEALAIRHFSENYQILQGIYRIFRDICHLLADEKKFNEALKIAGTMDDINNRASKAFALSYISSALLKNGELDKALEVAQEALHTTRSILKVDWTAQDFAYHNISNIFCDISKQLEVRERQDEALLVAEEAEKVALMISQTTLRDQALSYIKEKAQT